MDEKESILIVDDDESIYRSLSLVLGKKGFETVVAETGQEAIEKTKGKFFNAALVDIKLPDVEGTELLAPLKELHPDMALIVVTGYASLETAVQALNNGASAYITKPLNIDEVLAAAQEVLEKQRLVFEKRQAEETLRESEEKYRQLVETLNDVIYATNKDGVITYINPAIETLSGYKPSQVIGRSFAEFVCAEDLPRIREAFERVASGQIKTSEYRIRIKSGEIRWVRTSSRSIDEGGHFVGLRGVMTDVTDDKRAETKVRAYQERLRSLASELSRAEERERRRIATDLHDWVSQVLSVIKVKVGVLREELASNDLAEQVEEIRELVEQGIQSTRSLTFDLAPPVLYELGLEAALEWLAEQIQEQHGIAAKFEDDGQPKPIVGEVRVCLFRAARELLTNVVKHAQARNVRISVLRAGDKVRVEVQDDGGGFHPSEVDSSTGKTRGFGLFSIREWLECLGGYVELYSEPGRGTRVSLLAPLEHDERTKEGST